MQSQICNRAGAVSLAIGIADGIVTIAWPGVAAYWPGVLDGIAILAGIALLTGGPRATLWARSLAVFMLAASLALVIAIPVLQPLDLTLTEIRLDPAAFAIGAASIAVIPCLTFWIMRQLGRQPIRDSIMRARITRWDMTIPAQTGAGIVALSTLLMWLMLHGQSGELATSLALQQLGPGYRYHLSWISSVGNGHGTTVTGTVTAWNEREIRKVVLHWETR